MSNNSNDFNANDFNSNDFNSNGFNANDFNSNGFNANNDFNSNGFNANDFNANNMNNLNNQGDFIVPMADNPPYVQRDQWCDDVLLNPQEGPSSPLLVQPNGIGTPFITGEVSNPISETPSRRAYTPDYLSSQIGSLMRVEFLIGNQTTDRIGFLREVGASFIVLESVDFAHLQMCDLYAIKFVTILRSPMDPQISSLYGNMT